MLEALEGTESIFISNVRIVSLKFFHGVCQESEEYIIRTLKKPFLILTSVGNHSCTWLQDYLCFK